MSDNIISKQSIFMGVGKVSSIRQAWAARIIAATLLILLVVPTIYILPNLSLGGINRPLYELVNFFIVAIWIWIRMAYGSHVPIRPKWFDVAFWLLPITFVLSDLVYLINGGSLGSKHLYAILNSLRPIALVQLSMFVLRWGKVEFAKFGAVLRVLVNVISYSVIYMSILALLQLLEVGLALDFLDKFYRFEGQGPEDLIYIVVQNYGRTTSIFHWVNIFGLFLAVALLVLFVYILDNWNIRRLLLPITAIATGLFGVMASGSRMAFIALTIGVFVTLILRRRFRVLMAILVGGVIIYFAMRFIEQKTGQTSRFTELFSFISGEGSVPQTLEYRFGNTSTVFSAFISSDASQWTGTTVTVTEYRSLVPSSFDNEYLKYLICNGYLGLAAFVLFQISVIFRSWLAFKYSPAKTPDSTLSLALLAVSISLMVSAYSQDAWGGERLLELVFIILGMLVYFRNLQVKNSIMVQAK